MPPALSDDEASDAGDFVVPILTKGEDNVFGNNTKKAEIEGEEDIDKQDRDEDMAEDEFVVQEIVGHLYVQGRLKFKVKWEGYDSKDDLTWEDEDNLRENASEILGAYLESVGGRDKIISDSKAATQKKRGRPAASIHPSTNGTKRSKRESHPVSDTPPASASKAWTPPAGSWEDHIASIDACHDESTGKLIVYLSWKNGHKTQHDTKIIYSRCPQKMLQFYEQHVKIVKPAASEADLY